MLTCPRSPVPSAHMLAIISASAAAVLLCTFASTNPANGSPATATPTRKNTANSNASSANPSSGKSANTKPTTPVALDGKNSFRITQHSEPSGEDEILISPLGIKITNLRNKYVSLLPKPFTEVYSYSIKTKKIFHGPLKDYKSPFGNSMALLKSVTFDDITTTKFKEATYKGCSAIYSKISKEVMAQRQMQVSNKDLVDRAPRLFEIVTSSKLNVPDAAGRFLYHYYGLRQKPGLPLQVEYTTFSQKNHHYLTTDTIEAKSFKPTDFAPPANLTKVKNTGELLLDDDSADSVNLMIMDH
jgi:hypothetical protein